MSLGNNSNLPAIGAQAVLAGVDQFQASANRVRDALGSINSATSRLETDSTRSYQNSSAQFNTFVGNFTGGTGRISGSTLIMANLIADGIEHAIGAFVRLSEEVVTAGATFEKTLNPVAAITQASTSQMQQLGDEVLKLGSRFNISDDQIARGAAALAQRGVSYKDITEGTLAATTALAVLSTGQLSEAQAAAIVQQSLHAYNLTGAEAMRVTDAIAGAAVTAAGGYHDFEQGLRTFLPVAAAMHIPIEDAAASIGVLTNAGLSGTMAGTNLRQMFIRLEDPTSKARKVLEDYGISLFDVQGKFIGMEAVFSELNKAFGDQAIASGQLTEQQRDAAVASIGMSRAMLGVIAAAVQGPEAFEKVRAAQARFADSGNIEQYSNTAVDQLGIVMNQLKSLEILFDSTFGSALKGLLEDANTLLRSIDFASVRQAGEEAFKGITDFVEELIPHLGRLLAPAKGIYDFLASLVNLLVRSSALAIIKDTVGIIVTSFETWTVILGTLWETAAKALDSISTSTSNVGTTTILTSQQIASAAKFIVDSIETVVAVGVTVYEVYKQVTDGLYDAFTSIAKTIYESVSNIENNIQTWIVNFGKGVADIVRNLTGLDVDWNIAFKALLDTGISFAKGIGEVIDQVSTAFVQFVPWFFDNVVTPLVKGFNILVTAGASLPGPWQANLIEARDSTNKFLEDTSTSIHEWSAGVVKSINEPFDTPTLPINELAKTIYDKLIAPLDISGKFNKAKIDVKAFFDEAYAAATAGVPQFQAYLQHMQEIIKATQDAEKISRARATGELPFQVGIPGPGGGIPATPGPDLSTLEGAEKAVRALLQGFVGLNDEIVKYIAGLVKADPERLSALTGELMSQNNIIRQILEAKRELLATDIQIAEIDSKLAILENQTKAAQLAQQQADLPFEQQSLELKTQEARITLQMLPIQNAIADIDKQVALAQRDNLQLKTQQLQVQLQMLPIQNQIADIDKKIAETQKERYDLQAQEAALQLQMLPIQNQISDIEQKISDRNREDYAATRARLQLEQQIAPIKAQIADIDAQIAQLNQTNYDLANQQIEVQLRMIGPKAEQRALERQIAELQRTNYDLAIQKARLIQQEIPYHQQIADLERQITEVVDQRQQLEMRRDELIAQRNVKSINTQLKTTKDQLDALWGQFGSGRGPNSASLIPQILDLEQQQKSLQAGLKPAQDALDAIKSKQEDVNTENELATINLKLQEQQIKDMLKPIDAEITAINNQEEAQKALNDITILGLQQQKQAVDDVLADMQLYLDSLKQQEETEKLQNDLRINALQKQKQALTELLVPLQDQLRHLQDIYNAWKLANEIANTYDQEQLQNLQKTLEGLQNQLTAVQREEAEWKLRQTIVRLALEEQKQKLQELLKPLQDMLDAITREQQAEQLRHDIAVAALEEQKRKLEDLLRPLQDAKDAVTRQTEALDAQKRIVDGIYQAQILGLRSIAIEQDIYKNQLQDIKLQEQQRLSDLIQKFKDTIVQSGAFTTKESEESTKRLGLWGPEVDKISALKDQYGDLNGKLGSASSTFQTLSMYASSAEIAFAAIKRTLGDDNLNGLITTAGTNAGTTSIKFSDLGYDAGVARDDVTGLGHSLDNVQISMQNAATYIRDTMNGWLSGTDYSLAAHANQAADAVKGITSAISALNAISAAPFSQQLLKIIATQAAANAEATGHYNLLRNQGYTETYSAGKAYEFVRDSLLNPNIFAFAQGGLVPGYADQAQLALVHGGEFVLPRSIVEPLMAQMRSSYSYNSNSVQNFNFNANYSQPQPGAGLEQDLRTIIGIASR